MIVPFRSISKPVFFSAPTFSSTEVYPSEEAKGREYNKSLDLRWKKSKEPDRRLFHKEKSIPTLKFKLVSHFRLGVARRSVTNPLSLLFEMMVYRPLLA